MDPRRGACLQCGDHAIRFDRKRPVPATFNAVTSHPGSLLNLQWDCKDLGTAFRSPNVFVKDTD